MTSTINLNDFVLEGDENGTLVGKNDYVFIKSTKTRRFLKEPFYNVADFYGFGELNLPTEISQRVRAEFSTSPFALLEEEHKTKMVSLDVENPKLNNYNNILVFKWDEEQTRFMLQIYNKYITCVGRFKKFRTKKLMWSYLAKQIEGKFKVHLTAKQVETRLKCVKKRRKKGSGVHRKVTVYNDDDELDEQDRDTQEDNDDSKSLGGERFFETFEEISARPDPDPAAIAVSPLHCLSSSAAEAEDGKPCFTALPKSSSKDIQQKLLNQKNDFFLKYFEMKDHREENKIKEKRRYNEEKLKILDSMVAENKRKTKTQKTIRQ
ncbi:uncharacterized protein LOC129920716 [Episyrphus balteatus]|uniref:uncharacterized protein LOC129920716 n=1 Tax=Episyrphus balteatus TaxID=286459 RepID=UPI002484F73B|nr:uncharacterized protein LOC129920716 [Episyrphus balteatus]XP_055858236.1 uncharacterized protein LOC129920716 [Episyrphus balteatus]XP_055858237.1 uncharacterized protein LOC129920716 [Episyrphus balteatus]XP_055858238.1 uncharacterized protein LOC129920716 [Episyrphus balteatus]